MRFILEAKMATESTKSNTSPRHVLIHFSTCRLCLKLGFKTLGRKFPRRWKTLGWKFQRRSATCSTTASSCGAALHSGYT